MSLRSLISAILFFSACLTGSGSSYGQEPWGELQTVSEVVNIRERRTVRSKIVGKLAPGDLAKTDFVRENWAAVFLVDEAVQDESRCVGFVYAPLLRPALEWDDSESATPDETSFTLSDEYCKLESDFDLPNLKKFLPQLSRISEPHTDDLSGMLKRRTIRVLTTYSLANYFISEGRSFGFEYSLLKDYERFLNRSRTQKDLGVIVEFLPLPQDQLVSSLLGGLGDIVASGLTVPEQQNRRIDYTSPYLSGVREVFVSHKSAKEINTLQDLAGRQITVRPIQSHHESLGRLNEQLVSLNLQPMQIIKTDGFLKPVDVLEMLNAGIFELSVIQSHLSDLWQGIFPNLKVYDQIPFRAECSIAWMVRKNNPQLKASLNTFINNHKRGTLHGNIYYNRYFEDVRWIKNPLNNSDRDRFSRYAPLIKKYSARYGFDWMLIAAIAYQESGLNPRQRSPEGAIGLMQVMPSTAKGPHINIHNLHWLENNVHAGTKYLAMLRDTYFSDPGISSQDRIYFSLAAYNAGPRKIRQARALTASMGYDPNQWFYNCELGTLKLIGQETVRYVSNVNKYYLTYSLADTLDCLKERKWSSR